ncbi:hypothetical protein SLOPH_1693 [Spraguea lophii 42_110]|uniref:FAR-17a/AIG1-like protein n=1 Tax=Spraguea lophii (strain 42_110) TaxID=1358809 RepID=S7XIS6_SPRLO|nr:hypothetical protein SLOPH_1693 [Spraguea lophii 42_110]
MIIDLLRIICLSCFVYVSMEGNLPEKLRDYYSQLFAGRKQFLTILSLYATIFSIVMGIAARLSGSLYLKTIFEATLSLAFIAETIVTIMFWALYFYDKKLIFSKDLLDESMQSSFAVELILHLLPICVLIMEVYINPIRRDLKQKIIVYVFSYKYLLWLYYLSYKNNKWPYPFLETQNDLMRIAIIFVVTSVGVIVSEIIFYLIDCVRTIRNPSKDE